MADYYQDPMQEPSLAHQYFGSPLRAQWTLQKWSMMMTGLNSGMWKAAMAGQGLKWSGVVGFRGIALGASREVGMAPGLSPSRLISRFMSGERAEAFKKFGLFGAGKNELGELTGGLLNRSGKEGIANVVGRFLGGGNIQASRFKKRTIEEIEKIKWNKVKYMTERNFAPEVEMKYFNKINETGKKVLSKQKLVTRIAKVGRLANWAFAAKLAFDVGSATASFAVNTVGDLTNLAEQKLTNMFNRQMEFGGKVGIGFMSGGSGNDRQRALSAVGRYGGGVGMGNEASYQHVDSTW